MQKLGVGSKINHPKFGLGVICTFDQDFYKIYFNSLDEVKAIAKDFDKLEVIEQTSTDVPSIEIKDIENALESIFLKYSEDSKPVHLASKWIGGELILAPGNKELQNKVVPLTTFFNKIIAVREKLRVLEQNINNHVSLNEQEKLHLQQYISRAYGSLTTFNILFADKEDQFKGMGK